MKRERKRTYTRIWKGKRRKHETESIKQKWRERTWADELGMSTEHWGQFLGAVTVHSDTCYRPIYVAPVEIITTSLKFIKL
jgi:hypothetical protein